MRKYLKQLGQGMTEYIIIVALIAIAAIAVYQIFGDVVRSQTGSMASELGGTSGQTLNQQATTQAGGSGDASQAKSLSDYAGGTGGG
jgi:Flp pilus assembly pilin Flp